MSLDDKFYPDDGTALTRFDNALIKVAGRVGEAYQHLTGKPAEKLMQNAYVVAAAGIAIGALVSLGPVTPGGVMLGGYVAYLGKHRTRESPLEEEIRMEASDRSKSEQKICRAALTALSTIAVAALAYLHEKAECAREYGGHILLSSSVGIWAFAEYLSKANIPKPPEKTVFSRAKDRVVGWVQSHLPEPAYPSPRPVYAPVR